ncbi:MAG TPA: hypothetical protein VNV82_12040 [Bryobacteraceae bacterium]|jgi:putative transposase|nr:hypothetical protein [Bryobacteraceae bacterium]
MRNKKWVQLLAYVRGSVNQELLPQNEYLTAENRIVRAKLPSRLRLSDPERATRRDRETPGTKSTPSGRLCRQTDTILAWYRRLVAKKFDGSKHRQYPGRPAVAPEVEAWWCEWRERTTAGHITASSEL